MKTYKITLWGQTEELALYKTSYSDNGTLAVIAETTDGEPYATLTVNLPGNAATSTEAFLDTNNCPWVTNFVRKYRIAKWTGIFKNSGYCYYPLYRFDLSKFEERK